MCLLATFFRLLCSVESFAVVSVFQELVNSFCLGSLLDGNRCSNENSCVSFVFIDKTVF